VTEHVFFANRTDEAVVYDIEPVRSPSRRHLREF
jgi:hypothetical protein